MTAADRPPRVLSIAGSDPSGGAGIQADLKSIAAFDGYGMAAITSLTVQNTRGVQGVHAPPASFLAEQLEALDDDIEIDAVKIGMLHSSDVVAVVDRWLERVRPPVVVLDPVMVATSGHRLLDADAEDAVRRLAHRADLVTPNLPELAVLVNEPVALTWEAALDQGRRLAAGIDAAVLVKGGHLEGPDAPDAIVTAHTVEAVPGHRVTTRNTHGTGCSLSSAIATARARGLTWHEALVEVKDWLVGALESSDLLEVGTGHGPIDHLHGARGPGEWARTAWCRGSAIVQRITTTRFVRELGDGTLDPDDFRRYLAQDALYLDGYGAVLAHIAELAPSLGERAIWRAAVDACATEVDRLHRDHLAGTPADPVPVTTGYLSHLRAAADSGAYAHAVAAVLPCYTVYADLGVRWLSVDRTGHPFADWLDLYGGAEFVRAAAQAERIASSAALTVDAAVRARMNTAYRVSLQWERRFFAETSLTRG